MAAQEINNEQQAKDVLNLFRAVGEASPMPMLGLAGSTHIVRYVNPAFCLLIGKTEQELLGHSFFGIAPAGEECLSLLERVYRTGHAETHSGTESSASHPLYWSYAICPVLAVDTRPLGIILQVIEETSFHQDAVAINEALMLGSVRQHELTESAELLNAQLQAEIVVRKNAEEALIGSEKQYADLYEFAPIAYMTLDSDARISEINLTGALLLGEERQKLVQCHFAQFVTPGDVGRYFHLLRKVMKQDERQTSDLALRRGDGSVFHAQLDCVRVPARAIGPAVRITIIDITERKRAEARIEHLAFYDPLTQLPNRRLLLNRLQQALTACVRTLRYGAVLFIDLDDFKALNDTQGHHIGDLLLQQVAARLKACVRASDMVARLGGDEFVVILQDLSSNLVEAAAQTKNVGEKLLATLSRKYLLAGYEYHTSGSIGTTLFRDHREPIEDLLKRADLALYRAKTAGPDNLRFFDPEMQLAVTTRTVLV